MIKKYLTNCLCWILLIGCASCTKRCCDGSEKAPTLELQTCSSIRPSDFTIYALDEKKKPQLVPNWSVLPISIISDTTTYIFSRGQKSDTLTLSYKRKFYYESERCGFMVQIENLKMVEKLSSFDSRQAYAYVSPSNTKSGYVWDGVLSLCK
jgi:Family of unknown function (DUF6452)